MNENEKITQIVEELISLDSELKKYRQQLPEIIQSLISLKPDIKIDNDFAEKLKHQLIEKIINQKENNKNNNFNYMKKINYSLIAIVFILILSLPLWIYQKNNSGQLAKNPDTNQIAKLGREAFGSLISTNSNNTASESMAAPSAFGGGTTDMISTINEDSSIDSKRLVAPESMPYYQPTYYQYIYQGDEFELSDQELAVLKRIKGQNASTNFDNLNLNLLNLNNFDKSGLNNFTINQDKKYGYSIYVNLKEGMISLNENWEQWYDQNYVYREMKNTDLPSDANLIALTDNFLNEYQIDQSIYGPAEIQNNWQNVLPMAADASTDSGTSQIYPVPNNISVIYPLLVNNKQVYDDWGNKQGLQLNINLEYKKVSSLYNLTTQNYQSSQYKMETDKEKILKILKAGGLYNNYGNLESNAKIIEVAVGTPKVEYVKVWQYQNNSSEELLVPALVFPIFNPENVPELYRKQVVIPLAQEIIDRAEDQGPIRTLEILDK